MSTFFPKTFSNSSFISKKVKRVIGLKVSIRKSISLSGEASPLAYDPKMPAFLTLYFLRIGFALSRIVSTVVFMCLYYDILIKKQTSLARIMAAKIQASRWFSAGLTYRIWVPPEHLILGFRESDARATTLRAVVDTGVVNENKDITRF